MASIYFDDNCSIELDCSKLILRGRFGYKCLPPIESFLTKSLIDKPIESIDFTKLESFDTSLVVLLCCLRAVMIKQNYLDVAWHMPKKLIELISLYGLQEYF